MTEKKALCSGCDIYCQVLAEVPASGKVGDVRVKAVDSRPLMANICMKGVHAPSGFGHPKRVTRPLRRVGARGEGRWAEVSWDAALDEIANRLSDIVAVHGSEALAVSTSQWNTQTDNGAARRFMNLLGSPNWISGVAICAGNTAAVNRLVYGWYPYPDFPKTNCIVLFGHNPKKHSWTPIYNAIRRAQERGAKLIVLDPRRSENAELADLWLPLRPGSDAAMCFGWLKVILDEELYDKAFVQRWTKGFEALKARVEEFPLDRVARLTGVAPELIAQAARMYAASGPSVIPWTPITDQQRNSTSAIRLMCTLRAICGYLDVPGGEVLHGFHRDIIHESELEMHEALSATQQAKQLGCEAHPAFTYRAMARLSGPAKRVWGYEWPNLITGSYMANPSAVFRAMADSDPYPVRAFFTLGNNTLMSFANMQLIQRALLKQDLIVAVEHFRTPTAQLADFILPGDAWLERNALADGFGWTSIYRPSQKVVEPPGECRGVYDFWRGLAMRMGLSEAFPWETNEDVLDYRLQRLKQDFASFAAEHAYHMNKLEYRKYERTGFATPSGLVELSSELLEELGFDPLPYWRDDPPHDPAFPFSMFMGVRDDEFFQTGHRHIASLRARKPDPLMFITVRDAAAVGLGEGDWAQVVTRQGRVKLKASLRADMPDGVIRVPHGWWLPEREEGDGTLSGAWEYADAQICPDDREHLDREQGIPHLKGIACRVERLTDAATVKQPSTPYVASSASAGADDPHAA
ncbi:dehydrogenase [Variovorax sp. WS11]|uniref:molybdopterin-containing oxidoreductase family protein n=1 Tax=Variovorax sp. WS11 TaxID=1105204 RepID=UPI000D0CF832|nr:molybdopterin-dependent oxidoreductase [Variovorax sp. WS11]NDZ17766.1 molybdopterin-dependent oxidoreductase [Variovorax sp. WS11]PSL80192.1 dehydrogenase [Variovorax sp. WS11]